MSDSNTTRIFAGIGVGIVFLGAFVFRNKGTENLPLPSNTTCDKLPKECSVSENSEIDFISHILEVVDKGEDEELDKLVQNKEISTFFSMNIPSCGLAEVILSVPQKGTKTCQQYKIRDLIYDLLTRSKQLKEEQCILEQYECDLEKYIKENQLLAEQKSAEEYYRIKAEEMSTLMQNQLDKLHRQKREIDYEREELLQKYKETKIELEIVSSTRYNPEDASKKVQQILEEIEAEDSKSRDEAVQLQIANKALYQSLELDKKKREDLLREVAVLKAQLGKLTGHENSEDNYHESTSSHSSYHQYGYNSSHSSLGSTKYTYQEHEKDYDDRYLYYTPVDEDSF